MFVEVALKANEYNIFFIKSEFRESGFWFNVVKVGGAKLWDWGAAPLAPVVALLPHLPKDS
jgi:hypothetical protein